MLLEITTIEIILSNRLKKECISDIGNLIPPLSVLGRLEANTVFVLRSYLNSRQILALLLLQYNISRQ